MRNNTSIKEKYFMDDPREGQRLERKVNGVEFVNKFLKRHLEDISGKKILEAGCGPGVFIRVIGDNYPAHVITGIDLSEERVNDANKKLSGIPNAQAICGDIYDLPFPDNYFDFIYSRFLFEYLANPVAAAKELCRVCKPGGKILIQDLDSQFTFYPELSSKLTEVLELLNRKTGFDPNIGRKLFSIGTSAGFSFVSNETEIYHNVFGKIDDFNYDLWRLKLDIALTDSKQIVAEDVQELKTEMLDSLRNEHSIMFSILFTATFEKP